MFRSKTVFDLMIARRFASCWRSARVSASISTRVPVRAMAITDLLLSSFLNKLPLQDVGVKPNFRLYSLFDLYNPSTSNVAVNKSG